MIHSQAVKVVNVTPPAAILDNASAATTVIDCKGFDYCTIYVSLGATDIAMAALKVQESDTLSGADLENGADVTGLVYGTSTDIAGSTSALPTAGNDDKVFAFDIDLRARKRYLDLVATAGDGSAGTYVAALAVLWRAEQTPTTAAQRGCQNILRV